MPRSAAFGTVAIVAILNLAGCLGADPSPSPGPTEAPALPTGPVAGTGVPAVFSTPLVYDTLRAGGEPVIAVTAKGTILISAHPGYTHWHPSATAVPPTSAELIAPTQGQSYMWRSTDGGKTFKSVSLLPVESPNSGPRGVGQGVSDPDFTIDAKGKIYFTDLEALADASVSWSEDDGATWLMGNNDAAGGVVDRNWLASFGTTVYFRGNGVNDVRKSEDGGRTFTNVGEQACGGDILANPLDGHLFVGCPNGFTVSTDGGKTWTQKRFGSIASGPISPEVAIDAAGTVYRAVDPGRTTIVVYYTHDEGETWGNYSLLSFFPELANGTLLWPWASAGSDGRLSVTFFGSPTPRSYQTDGSELFVYNAIILNASSPSPEVYATKVTPKAIHRGGMCQGGTGCQVSTATSQNSDRRMGDFFETTIDLQGFVHIVYSDTQVKPNDTISHVGYARLVSGPSLVEGPLPPGFPTQG